MQNYRKIIRPHLITKHPMTEKNCKKAKYDTAGYENPKPLCGKRKRIPRHLLTDQPRCRQLGSRGQQKMTTAKCLQTKITKLANKIKVRSPNECWPRLIHICSYTYLRKLLATIPPSRPSPLVRASKVAISVCSVFLHFSRCDTFLSANSTFILLLFQII